MASDSDEWESSDSDDEIADAFVSPLLHNDHASEDQSSSPPSTSSSANATSHEHHDPEEPAFTVSVAEANKLTQQRDKESKKRKRGLTKKHAFDAFTYRNRNCWSALPACHKKMHLATTSVHKLCWSHCALFLFLRPAAISTHTCLPNSSLPNCCIGLYWRFL